MNIVELLKSASLGDVLTKGGVALIIILTIVQITPIKLNPWGWVAKKIGRAINQEVISKVDKLEKDVLIMQSREDEREANLCRTRILRFGDEILHGQKHSKEHFDQTLIDITYYENYCETHPKYKNSVASMAIQKVRDTYRRCLDGNTFL